MFSKGYEVIFIGAKAGIESEREFTYGKKILVDITGIRGKSIYKKVVSSGKLLKSTLHVVELIKTYKPKFSLVFGGYTSVPLGLASYITGTPLFVHEQNSIPSYTNVLLSKFARKIFYTFDYTEKYFKKNTVKSGMPLRKTLKRRLNLTKEEARKLIGIDSKDKLVLIFGGSQGARIFGDVLGVLSKEMKDIKFILIKGKNVSTNFKESNVITFDYYEDIGILYKASDIVISRAGAGTVSELVAFGKYAIYVPYKFAASNHQYYNSLWLKEHNLANIIEEDRLSIELLRSEIEEAFKKDLISLEREISSKAILNSEEIILKEIEDVIS